HLTRQTTKSMRTVLICHQEEELNRTALPRWLASFSTLAGVVVLQETSAQRRRRAKRELKRVGPLRFRDVLAFRLYYAAFLARTDQRWDRIELASLFDRFPELPVSTR